MFSHLLLIACICIVVVLVLYFFYWNRFIAFVIGHAIRIFFWNQEGSSVWVEIGKFQLNSVHEDSLIGYFDRFYSFFSLDWKNTS